MKKLVLEIDQLAVESFATDAVRPGAGTIRGNAVSEHLTECGTCTICPGCVTLDGTCPAETCAYTCGDSCGCPTFGGETCGIC